MYSERDLRYIEAEFVPLTELCAATGRDLEKVRAAISERRSPAPPYEGVEYVPANYFDLPDAIEFRRIFAGDEPDAVLEAYLSGVYFVCVRDATPANIARKEQLAEMIRGQLDDAHPDDVAWRTRLHELVDELDELERPFSPDFDRARFAHPLTRDELIVGARERFPRDAEAAG